MVQQLSIAEAQTICLRNNIPFYTYRLPNTDDIVFGAQLNNDITLFKGFEHHRGEEGFIITPFNPSSWSFPFIIHPDISFKNTLTDKEAIINLQTTAFNTAERSFTHQDCNHTEYLDEIQTLKEQLEQENIKKVVLSRTITIPYDTILASPHIFAQMLQYHHAFVFFVSIPGKCAWMGATPETFLRYDREGFKTMSLAGTQPINNNITPTWGEKDIVEQQIVTDYIAETLRPFFRRNLEKSESFTAKAGNVYHLCTLFQSDEQLPADQIDELVKALHPTPAVCGIPKKKAMQIIMDIEKQDRNYYTGFLGPLQRTGAFDLFVNLRTMELFDDALKLYVGGGITSASDPESEWLETCEKANTILNLIKQITYGKFNF